MSRLRITGLRRTFPGRPPVDALRSVDLTVEEGSLTAVLGPSGCGKTTLLRTVAGMERADGGTVEIGDATVAGPGLHVPPERRTVGLVPQEGALFPHLDVGANVAFGLQRSGREDRRRRAGEMLDLVGLGGFERRRPHELSGGQQQRVALARALAPAPAAVLLDEPFSALDTGLRARVRADVAATLRAAGTTSVLVTHDQIEAMTMADTVAVMRAGTIVQVDSPADVYRRPVDAWVARFLGDAVLLPGRRDGDGAVSCLLGRLPLAAGFAHHPGPDVTVFCRPEQLRPTSAGGEPSTVLDVRFLGPDVVVDLDLGGRTVLARWPSSMLPGVGDRACLAVDGAVLAFAPEP